MLYLSIVEGLGGKPLIRIFFRACFLLNMSLFSLYISSCLFVSLYLSAFVRPARFSSTRSSSRGCRGCCRLLPDGLKLHGGARGGRCGASARQLCLGGPCGPPARLRRLRRRSAARQLLPATASYGRKNGEGQVVIFRVVRVPVRVPCVLLTPFTPLYTRVCMV